MSLINLNPAKPLLSLRVAALVSGGVDSCVASLLLKKKGCRELVGVFMKNWEDDEPEERCRSEYEKDRHDAKSVCDKLDIEFREVSFVKEYWNQVFLSVVADYQNGLTPNPDILCNERIKFGAFLDYASNNLNVDLIATGHYAGSSNGPFYESPTEEACALFRAKDVWKDQSFFLSQINQKSLRRVIFPLEHLLKSQVRQIAQDAGFDHVLKRKSSKGICFIGSRNFQSFIENYIQPTPGPFVDIDSDQVVGQHNGFHYWTLGQRARLQGYTCKYFIARKSNRADNVIYVASDTNHHTLFSNSFVTDVPHWIGNEPIELSRGQLRCLFKFQHVDPLVMCTVASDRFGGLKVSLDEPKRCLTPGQFAVFYIDNRCIGSARIKDVL